ncbi:MAG: 23S ribosomal RNA methyltransferase Erm [Bacillota bacterium]
MNRQDKGHRKVRKWRSGPNFSGQHLMHNKEIIKEIIKQAQIKSKDTVIDLGAGKGALTFPLAEKAGKVLAVENDPAFAEILRRKAADYSNITIIEKDILKLNLPQTPFYVVANIPYAITTPILEKLLNKPTNALQGAMIMVEKGAAKRFTANPIMDSRILRWRMWFDIELARVVSRDNFSPPPKVDSAVLRIKGKNNPKVSPKQHLQFMGLAENGLKYPQWPICEALKSIFTPPQMNRLMKNIGMDRDTPICLLSEEQWGDVFHTVIQYVEPFRWPKGKKMKK